MKNSPLTRQLEMVRFERAMEVAESVAAHRALLTTSELARMNNVLTGKDTTEDPWRQGPVTITLPSGRSETLNVLVDAKNTARDKLHHSTELAEGGSIIDAAIDIYVGLVLAHVFLDANRRTAVLAAHYFLRRYGVPLSGLAIHEMGLGDLREADQLEHFRDTVHQMARFAEKKRGGPKPSQ